MGGGSFPGAGPPPPLPGGPSETCRNLTFFARCATTSATFAHLGLAVRRGAIVHGDALAFGPQGAGRPHFLRAIRESAPQRLGGPSSLERRREAELGEAKLAGLDHGRVNDRLPSFEPAAMTPSRSTPAS